MIALSIFCLIFLIQKGVQATLENKYDSVIQLTPNILSEAYYYQSRRRQPAKLARIKSPLKSSFSKTAKDVDVGVICSQGRIGIAYKKPLAGRIYASHQENNSKCVQYLHEKIYPTWFVADIAGPCGVQITRLKSATEYQLRIIVSKSYNQLTEDDQIYDVICHYNDWNTTVEAYYDVANFQTHSLVNSPTLPTCEYSLHSHDTIGPTTQSANVGDTVYHRWSCSSKDYLFKIYRCYVHNGMDKSYMIIDENGCSLDEDIVPHPEYDTTNAIATAPAKAFRFSNSKRVHFNCLLTLCHKNDPYCQKSIPPRCPRSQRKRDLSEDAPIEERLLRIHHLLSSPHRSQIYSNNSSNDHVPTERIISLSSNDLHIADIGHTNSEASSPSEGVMASGEICLPSSENLMAWVYFLSFSNALSICCATLAFIQLARNRYTIEISKYRKSIGHHFQF